MGDKERLLELIDGAKGAIYHKGRQIGRGKVTVAKIAQYIFVSRFMINKDDITNIKIDDRFARFDFKDGSVCVNYNPNPLKLDDSIRSRCKRKPLWSSLFGSWNYNLNMEDSDKDIRVYVAPSFDDLYDGTQYTDKICEKGEDDYDFHDIRRLPILLFKSNITWIENLYSVSQTSHIGYMDEIIEMRDEIAVMNLRKMHSTTEGHVRKKMELVKKGRGTKSTQHLVDKFGYDTKEFLHAMRMVDVVKKFYANDFKDFGKCLKCNGQERKIMLEYKCGKYSKDEAMALMKKQHSDLVEMESLFDIEPNEDTLERIKCIVKKIVRKEVLGCRE